MTTKAKSTIIAACLAATLSGGAYLYDSVSETPEDQSERIALNRQWIDKIPQGNDDLMNILIFADIQGQKTGIYADMSEYRQYADYLDWNKEGSDSIVFHDMQDRKKHTLRYRAYECTTDGFEFCMDVKLDGQRSKTYYSFREWEIGSVDHVHDIKLVHLDSEHSSHESVE